MGSFQDLTGQRFGRLVVKKRGENKYSPQGRPLVTWDCICDCGSFINVRKDSLTNGHTCSCGCLHKEQLSQSSLIDLTGQTFGELKVLYRDSNKHNNDRHAYWICLCSCGNIGSHLGKDLRSGKIKSCGHVSSFGEEYIKQYLDKNNIKYTRQKRFVDCRDVIPLPFDFYVSLNNNINFCCEFDGSQHFYCTNFFGAIDKEEQNSNLEITRNHDKIKNEYCLKNNIPLLRISYRNINNIDNILDEFIHELNDKKEKIYASN